MLVVTLLVLALAGVGFAETAFGSVDIRFRITIPSDWPVHEEIDDDGNVSAMIGSPDGEVLLAVDAASFDTALDAERRAAYERQGLDAVLDYVASALIGSLPGMQVTSRHQTLVAGIDARSVEYASPELGGSLLVFADGDALFILANVSRLRGLERGRSAYDRMVASFTFTRLAADDPASVNPLAPSDPLFGVFRGDSFAFTATLSAGDMTFSTDGVRHTLRG